MAGKQQSKVVSPGDGNRLGKELLGLLAIFCGLLFLLSLATFDSRDPWLNHVVSGVAKVHNKAGLFGAYLGGLLLDCLGYAAWVIPAALCIVGARRILARESWDWWRWTGFFLLAVCISMAGAARDAQLSDSALRASALAGNIANHGGGLLGHFIYKILVGWLSTAGAFLLWIFCLLLGVQMLVGFSWLSLLAGTARKLWYAYGTVQTARQEHKAKKELMLESGRSDKSGEHTTLDIEVVAKPVEKAVPIVLADEPESGVIVLPLLDEKEDNGLPPGLLPVDEEEPATEEQTPTAPYSLLPDSHPAISASKEKEKRNDDVPPWVLDFEKEELGSLSDGKSVDKYTEPEEEALPQPVIENEIERNSTIVVNERPEVIAAEPEKEKGFIAQVVDIVKKPQAILLPALELLGPVQTSTGGTPRSVLEEKGRTLMNCLTDFGIQGELVGITPGPVVTMFEIRPAPGVRVSRIANLSDDLALALKAVAVRIQAPVPGTDTVGIEIPNEIRETVYLRELIGSKLFQESKSLLTLALGKDIAGAPAVADLATMPHLLVAGATGAGKSVGINSIILSLIYKGRPDEVKLLLVDPKRVEMAIYADLPHLVHPVVTEMQLAKNALDWAVKEMERRYEDIARAGVRNIADYNAKLKNLGKNLPENMHGLEFMPYLVIIIDELADLMLVGAKEVETSIVRLAQLARAAGIHLILATQRPSVDVVTGLIKANFPCRISFQVTSKHDSRTILDTVGAEHLLGKGDMLFKPGGGKFQRMHGAFVSDATVQAVVDYWRSQQLPDYKVDFSAYGSMSENDGVFGGGEDLSGDPMYMEAVDFVQQQGKASISLIQRKFRIGFNKAARFIEQMERDGIVGPADGSKPRPVL